MTLHDYALEQLSKTGVCVLPAIPFDQIEQTAQWLATRPVHVNAHVPQTARNDGRPEPLSRAEAARVNDVQVYCVPTADAIVAPHLFERALEQTDVAAAWLGRDPPVCYSANAFWTLALGPMRPDIQDFHEDKDDEKFLAMFVYLTDVLDPHAGPHVLRGPDGEERTIYGPRGTVFLANTMLPHYGRKPQLLGVRGIAWFRWGVSDLPAAHQWDHIEAIPASALGPRYPEDPRQRETMRLLVTPP